MRRRVRPSASTAPPKHTPSLAEALDLAERLSYGDLVDLYTEIGALLDAGPGRPTAASAQADRQAAVLTALEAAVEYLNSAEPGRDPGLTVDEVRAVPADHRRGWSASSVIRAFETWRNATNALAGTRVHPTSLKTAAIRRSIAALELSNALQSA